ncbi:hypothetical protein U1769_19365 [Sphingomonas sp. ZT3P38]|uniref:hypothetical protein n=1 Tax=Parasphingomonas zepuensis TaxID=3096161 RepID=UPI002FC8F4E7
MKTGGKSEDDALRASLMKWASLVLIPGLLFVFGLIYLVMPSYAPPPQSWADGTYTHPCCAPVVLRNGTLTTGTKATRYLVSDGKFGHQIDVPAGIGVRRGQIESNNTFVFVHFNKDSMATPAIAEAKSLHLVGLDDNVDYVFVKQE